MRNINSFAAVPAIASMILLASSCSKEAACGAEGALIPEGYETVTLKAALDTRINGLADGTIKWNSGVESVSVFYTIDGEYQDPAEFQKPKANSTSTEADFSGTVKTPEDGQERLFKYAVLPYNKNQEYSAKENKIKANWNSVQTPQNADGITAGSILAGKITGKVVTLASTCAYLKVNVPITGKIGTRWITGLKSIKIYGHRTSDEDPQTASYMSGTSWISFDADGNPLLSPRVQEGYNYDVVNLSMKHVDNYGSLGGTIYCPVYPGTYDNLSFHLIDTLDAEVGFFEVKNTNVFTRGKAKDIGTVYFPYVKNGKIGEESYGTVTVSANVNNGILNLAGSANAITGHPATIGDYEFGFEAWAGSTQLGDIVATPVVKDSENVDFTATSSDGTITKVRAYAKVKEGEKVYGEEVELSSPKETRTVTFNFTDGKFTTEKFDEISGSFAYGIPEEGDYKYVNADGADCFPAVSYKYISGKDASLRKFEGGMWNAVSGMTGTAVSLLESTLSKTVDGVTYTIKFPTGQYTRTTSTIAEEKDILLMLASGYSIELPAFAGYKLTSAVCSNPSKSKYFARVVNNPATTIGSGNGATVVHASGDWHSIFETAVPIEEAEAGTVQYLKINTQCRMPYFTLEYTKQ